MPRQGNTSKAQPVFIPHWKTMALALPTGKLTPRSMKQPCSHQDGGRRRWSLAFPLDADILKSWACHPFPIRAESALSTVTWLLQAPLGSCGTRWREQPTLGESSYSGRMENKQTKTKPTDKVLQKSKALFKKLYKFLLQARVKVM